MQCNAIQDTPVRSFSRALDSTGLRLRSTRRQTSNVGTTPVQHAYRPDDALNSQDTQSTPIHPVRAAHINDVFWDETQEVSTTEEHRVQRQPLQTLSTNVSFSRPRYRLPPPSLPYNKTPSKSHTVQKDSGFETPHQSAKKVNFSRPYDSVKKVKIESPIWSTRKTNFSRPLRGSEVSRGNVDLRRNLRNEIPSSSYREKAGNQKHGRPPPRPASQQVPLRFDFKLSAQPKSHYDRSRSQGRRYTISHTRSTSQVPQSRLGPRLGPQKMQDRRAGPTRSHKAFPVVPRPPMERVNPTQVQSTGLGAEHKLSTPSLAMDRQSQNSHEKTLTSSQIAEDKCATLRSWEIWTQRIVFGFCILMVNLALMVTYLKSPRHPYLLGILVFMKSKDVLSTLLDVMGVICSAVVNIWRTKPVIESKWILSFVSAYAETEEQIMKTVMSLVRSKTTPHKQVICIVLDGKERDVLQHMSKDPITMERPYVTWRCREGKVFIYGGFISGIPIILIKKEKNAGKKDSLILGHDLFNFPRKDMPASSLELRKDIWNEILRKLIGETCPLRFDYIFCTDADSTIHEYSLLRLANALSMDKKAIAGCGALLVEIGNKQTEWSMWHLYQQFQYTFGQYIRRQAEGIWGRVTCLPGCITMIVVRSEMGEAVSRYAQPVTDHSLIRHQVQYLGTDRRLTWCMLSQGSHLRTIFVPDALSETVAPQTLSHYMSQRRRWASNAYFNDFFYLLGSEQRLVTRLIASIDIVRLTLVFYRVFNTGFFIHGMVRNFYFIKILPTLVVTKSPVVWYIALTLVKEPVLRSRAHKLLLGMCINQIISPILSLAVFVRVILNMGSQVWGKTGASTPAMNEGQIPPPPSLNSPKSRWSPRRLSRAVEAVIKGLTPSKIVKTLSPKKKATPGTRGSVAAKAQEKQPETVSKITTKIDGAETMKASGVDAKTPSTPSHRTLRPRRATITQTQSQAQMMQTPKFTEMDVASSTARRDRISDANRSSVVARTPARRLFSVSKRKTPRDSVQQQRLKTREKDAERDVEGGIFD